jgi:hypothetical protein
MVLTKPQIIALGAVLAIIRPRDGASALNTPICIPREPVVRKTWQKRGWSVTTMLSTERHETLTQVRKPTQRISRNCVCARRELGPLGHVCLKLVIGDESCVGGVSEVKVIICETGDFTR